MTRRATVRWFLPGLLAALVVVVGAALAPPVAAQEDAFARVEAEAGYGGLYLPGRRVPVRISIRADQLVRGTLEFRVQGLDQTALTVPVEVPGGSEKAVVVVVPTPSGFRTRDITVTLRAGNEAVTTTAELDDEDDEQLVGLLPGVQAPGVPPPLVLAMGAGTARFAHLDDDLLAADGALDPLGTIVAAPDEIAALPPAARANILDWVDLGGRLVVDAAPGTPLAGIPDAWQPADQGRVAAGLGEVRLSAGAAAAGRWDAVVEPTPTVDSSDGQRLNSTGFFGNEGLTDAVARDAGLQSLELPWLLGFLAAYVVLVGPVGFLLLRRGRAALAWFAIPVAAAVFAAGTFVVGDDLRSASRAAQQTVVEVHPGGQRASSVIGTVSRSGGDGTTSTPPGWIAGTIDQSFFGITSAGTVAVLAEPTGVQATVPLDAGDFGVVQVSGTLPGDDHLAGGLTVTSASDGGSVSGTIRNDTGMTVEEVGVFLGRAGTNVGDLEPGEEATFTVRAGITNINDPFTPGEVSVWPDVVGYDRPPRLDSVVSLSLTADLFGRRGPNARPEGVITAIGWTRDYSPPLAVSGREGVEGRSAIITRTNVGAGAVLAPGAAFRELVRTPGAIDLDDDSGPGPVRGALIRFVLPAGVDPAGLEFDIPRYMSRVEQWDGSAFVTAYENSGDQFVDNPFSTSSALVPVAPQQRVVWLRVSMREDFGLFDGVGLEIRSPRALLGPATAPTTTRPPGGPETTVPAAGAPGPAPAPRPAPAPLVPGPTVVIED